jgi:Transcriptional regulators
MTSFDPKHRTTVGGQITIALYRIAQAIDYLLRERGKTMHLSPAQIQTLIFLKYARPGVRTVGGVAQRLGVTYATASGVADALENKRFIERVTLPGDQRVVTLLLTEAGTAQRGSWKTCWMRSRQRLMDCPMLSRACCCAPRRRLSRVCSRAAMCACTRCAGDVNSFGATSIPTTRADRIIVHS